MIKIVSPLLLCFALLACQSTTEAPFEEEAKADINVMAYYVPRKNDKPEKLPLEKLTHIIYSFTQVIDGEMAFRHDENVERLHKLVAQREKHPHLKVMIACGGWTADGFSDAALTAESRKKFVQSAAIFVDSFQLDGVDIDWEYPGIPAGGIKARKEDTQNFTLLMKELREALDSLDRPQTLTFAAAGWKRYFNFIETTEVMKYVDYINIMTYDLVTAASPYTGHHTALGWIKEENLASSPLLDYMESRKEEMEKQGRVWEPRSTEKIVSYCVDLGIDPKQIVIGAAFYGRAWKGVPPQQNGLYQPNGGPYIGWCAYHIIRDTFESKNGFTRHWDSIAKAPYLYNPSDSIFISYEDTMSVKLKSEFAIQQQLGGIMFWELSNDTKEEHSLLDAIYATK